jgi:hypothetical protein
VRFYVPEWEDHVDAEYDFVTDEHSSLARSERNLAYIWDIFDRDPRRTPIDGVLISREQIEESPSRARRLKEYGVYDAPEDGTTLAIPDWLPTISDCGAWGYKELPFPPYGNAEMLDFYEQLEVDVGVTIDHLVLGSGHASRLYIDERALGNQFGTEDIPDAITAVVDVMIDEWPSEWPDYVAEHDSSIVDAGSPEPLRPGLFEVDLRGLDWEADRGEIQQRVKQHLRELEDDPRLVYRDDDMQARYDLTLDNLRTMREQYETGNYSFRLMCAIQGWDTSSYAEATRTALAEGYQYLGIGGVAGSQEQDVKRYVAAVGQVVKDTERAYETRIDTHVFGFAKTGAFETIGRSGMSSFDSASMLRAAWTGGQNYHLSTGTGERRYDALRVRYPGHQSPLADAIETALWGQEVLHALRAYDASESIPDAIAEWYKTAEHPLTELESYLKDHRWDERYDQSRLRDMTEAFRSHFGSARKLKANFSERFRKRIIKLLRDDSAESPVDFEEYTALIELARERLKQFPQTLDVIAGADVADADDEAEHRFGTVWLVVCAYARQMDDSRLLERYRDLLREKPWQECGCEVCTDLGIDVAIFRGNNRNRRRGFHNTRNFYDQFEEMLPKMLVVTKGGVELSSAATVEEFLAAERPAFWRQVHDLPVVEIGAVTARGVHEWWDTPPATISFAPGGIEAELETICKRYQDIFIDGANWSMPTALEQRLDETGCTVHVCEQSDTLRRAVLERLGYDERTIPPHPRRDVVDQMGIQDFQS